MCTDDRPALYAKMKHKFLLLLFLSLSGTKKINRKEELPLMIFTRMNTNYQVSPIFSHVKEFHNVFDGDHMGGVHNLPRVLMSIGSTS